MKKKQTHDVPSNLTPTKKRVFFLITLSIPVFLLVGTEILLRSLHYGPDLSLFKRHQIRGSEYYLMNPDVKFRYFGELNFAPTTSPEYFPVHKPQGTSRIFCLGGSTTVGYPYWYNGSFSSFLRDRLKATFPRKSVEVINLGMTATNSFTVLDITKELMQYEPDLILVYDGHNEFYGALGVASHQSASTSRFMSMAYLRLIHFRIFQLAKNSVQSIAALLFPSHQSISRSTMMETLARDQYVPAQSPLYDVAFSTFHDNLQEIRGLCQNAGIKLLLGTQVSNLRDHPPFNSANAKTLSTQHATSFHQLQATGAALRATGAIDSAIVALRSAAAIDSTYADTHYQLARCLDAKGKRHEALREYTLARDYDALRFRTDSKFNALIQSMDDGKSSFVADIETAFKAASLDSLIGNNLIVEHLHPNSRGYFLIAQSYARTMRANGILATQQEWTSADTVNETRLWNDRPMTELDERIATRRTEVLTSGWPFKNQFPTVDAIPTTDTLGQIAEKATEGDLDWKGAHEKAISFYTGRRDWKSVESEYKTIINQIPLDLEPFMNLAKLYHEEGRLKELAGVLTASLDVEPTIRAYRTLGDIALENGDAAGALKFYQRMDMFIQTPMEKLQNGYMISLAYSRANEPDMAKARLLELLKLRPDFQPAIELLVKVSGQLRKTPKE